MKRLLVLFFSLFLVFGVTAQELERQRVKDLDADITKAVQNGNYEKAALLKKEKELTEELVAALEDGDIDKAKGIKYKISQLDSQYDELTVLERELDEALTAEDYDKAAELKKEIEKVKNEKSDEKTKVDNNIGDEKKYSDNPMFMSAQYGDFLIGSAWSRGVVNGRLVNASSSTALMLGIKGYKRFSFGKGRFYRPGLDIGLSVDFQFFTREKIINSDGDERIPIFLGYTFGTGFANMIAINNDIGFEVNLNLNLRLQMLLTSEQPQFYIGPNFNPVFKFKYKKFSFGFETGFSALRYIKKSDVTVGLRETYFNFIFGWRNDKRISKR